jgi:hypothetical protein
MDLLELDQVAAYDFVNAPSNQEARHIWSHLFIELSSPWERSNELVFLRRFLQAQRQLPRR